MIYPGELFDGGQVGGCPIKFGKVFWDMPGNGLMLQGLGLTGFYGAAVGAERNIIVNGCGDFIANGDDAAKFFTDFPFEGLLWGFTVFDFTAGEFPHVGIGALGGKDPTVAGNDGTNNLRELGITQVGWPVEGFLGPQPGCEGNKDDGPGNEECVFVTLLLHHPADNQGP